MSFEATNKGKSVEELSASAQIVHSYMDSTRMVLTANEISEDVDLPKGTVRDALRTLREHGYVEMSKNIEDMRKNYWEAV